MSDKCTNITFSWDCCVELSVLFVVFGNYLIWIENAENLNRECFYVTYKNWL